MHFFSLKNSVIVTEFINIIAIYHILKPSAKCSLAVMFKKRQPCFWEKRAPWQHIILKQDISVEKSFSLF